MAKRPLFLYGWFIVVIAWICYGFGISPAYYSWGNFAPELIADLDLDREGFGRIFGVFTFLYSVVGLAVGPAMARFGIRSIMVGGFVLSSLGFFYVSRAQTLTDCMVGFAVLGGLGIGFATIIPCQALGQNWFLKRRALAIGLIFTAGGIVGRLVSRFDTWMLEFHDWRTGWVVIGFTSLVLAVIALLFVRDAPEKVGLRRDGATEAEERATLNNLLRSAGGQASEDWTASQAIRTPQFLLMIVCGIAYAVPWGVVVAHMRLHMEDMGLEHAAAFTGTMALISILGRLMAGAGDYLPPQIVLAVSLLLEGVGCGGLLLADERWIAYVCIALIGLGFGTAYVSVPVVFSHFFGRQAFGVTSGIRITITGIFNGLGPWVAGWLFESTGAYTIPFLGLLGLGLIGATSAACLRHPGAPPLKTAAIAGEGSGAPA